jgi:hypothetical protein
MVEAPAPLDQTTDPPGAEKSKRARLWTLVVACLGVLLVISSMVALNTALADVALQTSASQTQWTWIVDSYTLALACLLLRAGAIGDRYGRRGALGVRTGRLRRGIVRADGPVRPHHVDLPAGRRGNGRGVHHARHAVPADVGPSQGPASQGRRNMGRRRRVRGGGRNAGNRCPAASLVLAIDLLGVFIAAVALVPIALTVATSKETEPAPIDPFVPWSSEVPSRLFFSACVRHRHASGPPWCTTAWREA